MSIKNRPYFVRADKWEDFLNHKTDDEVLERCKRIDRMINMDIGHREIEGGSMDEMRLIDANEVQKRLLSYYSFVNENTNKSNYTGEMLMTYEVADMIEDCIENTPTVDPETLPIVQKLREELARVTAERDAAVSDLKKWKICATCKNYVPKSKTSNCKVRDEKLLDGNWAGCAKWEWCGTKEE